MSLNQNQYYFCDNDDKKQTIISKTMNKFGFGYNSFLLTFFEQKMNPPIIFYGCVEATPLTKLNIYFHNYFI